VTPAAHPRPVLANSRPTGATVLDAPAAGHVIEPLLKIVDLARILGCSRRLVERMRAAGKLPRPDVKIGKMPRWKRDTILRWIEDGGRP
jgi:predicted DNA-binding transcriptional regulator AlpA